MFINQVIDIWQRNKFVDSTPVRIVVTNILTLQLYPWDNVEESSANGCTQQLFVHLFLRADDTCNLLDNLSSEHISEEQCLLGKHVL